MAMCSAVTLCFASIFALGSAALLAIAFSTDNWQVIKVNREEVKKQALEQADCDQLNVNDTNSDFFTSPLYYTRFRGLFRECFSDKRDNAPQETKEKKRKVELYMSPVETWCHNLNWYIPDKDNEVQNFDENRSARIHMGRSMIALFIVAFFFMFVSFLNGLVGCWKTSPSLITSSAILMLLACLFSAGAMGLWHGVEHYEKMKIVEKQDNDKPIDTELFVKTWPDCLFDVNPDKSNTTFKYEWGYFVSWVGVCMALCSSILFSLAAVCIRNDKEREEAMNMQYLMPVYPQKQQQYGPYGYAAYPGPYYGSQYGLPQYGQY
jgi:hypothetical protein